MIPDNYIQNKKLICDWMDKRKYLIHYNMLKFHVRHGLVVDKTHETVSFKQSKWLENIQALIHKRELKLKMIITKISINYSKIFYMEKQWQMYQIV